ncbi:MAG: NAD+ synthase, partial [Candidatus Omnitrophica bacterium]|nr:NAD+ synthase [Candidatus Omnitrophota bacterium]
MKKDIRLGLAQINCTVGDLEGNYQKVTACLQKGAKSGVDILVFPELTLTGYPPEDLLLKAKFISDNLKKLNDLSRLVKDMVVVIGFVDRQSKNIFNAAAVIYKQKIRGKYHKAILPNYGVFDEKRYFSPGEKQPIFKFADYIFGVNICEDIWYENGPVAKQAKAGSKLILNINASPYHAGKIKEREKIIKYQAKANRVSIAYVNLVGGQDELVFDGQSMIIDSQGRLIARAQAFKEELLIADLGLPVARLHSLKGIVTIANKITLKDKVKVAPKKAAALLPVAEIYQALLLGLTDYVAKNNFGKAVIGLSGGIDSSLVAALAVDSLGKENVVGVFMPSEYSSQESLDDARQLAQNLGIKFLTISITGIFKAYLSEFAQYFGVTEPDITEENLQARIRGNILMALSNKFKWLVLTTGNKSEMSTGYATLYGDMAGGFAVIKDVPKILVYQLCAYRNSLSAVIPERAITK